MEEELQRLRDLNARLGKSADGRVAAAEERFNRRLEKQAADLKRAEERQRRQTDQLVQLAGECQWLHGANRQLIEERDRAQAERDRAIADRDEIRTKFDPERKAELRAAELREIRLAGANLARRKRNLQPRPTPPDPTPASN